MTGLPRNRPRSFRDLTREDRYYSQWADYRRRELMVVGLGLALLFVLVGTFLLKPLVGEDRSFLVLFVVWAICALVVSNFALFWHCPRCGKPFHIDFGRVSSSFATKCVHCGLPKWNPDGGPADG